MIAVVELGGKQYNVTLGTTFKTESIDVEVGKTFNVEQVLLVSETNGDAFKIGMPLLSDEKVVAKVLSHGRGEKIRVFKMKAKKRYQKVQGHRQNFTEVQIVEIGGKKFEGKAPVKTVKTEEKKVAVAKKVTTVKKTDTVKTEAEKAPKKAPAVKKTTKTAIKAKSE